MKFHKTFFLLLAFAICIVQCKKDEPSEDTEFNPSLTCIINSIDFNSNLIEVFIGQNAVQIMATVNQDVLSLQLEMPLNEGLVVPLDGTTISQAVYEDNINGIQYISDDGSLNITRYDEVSGELEGTFQFHGIEFFGSAEANIINGQFMAIIP